MTSRENDLFEESYNTRKCLRDISNCTGIGLVQGRTFVDKFLLTFYLSW